jgi:threonine dehydratase
VILGNGTAGLEILDDWADVDTIVVPMGGGGLSCGIALALRARGSKARIVACEVDTAAALDAARKAGAPMAITRHPSYVDGIGSNKVLDAMWPLLRELVDDVVVVSIEDTRQAMRAIARTSHLIVEGAGAAAVAAALSPKCGGSKVAAVLSGGNIDPKVLCEILSG